MCDAMHFAEELSGRYRDDRAPFAALSLSDASVMSCIGNDYGFDHVFARQVQALGSQEMFDHQHKWQSAMSLQPPEWQNMASWYWR